MEKRKKQHRISLGSLSSSKSAKQPKIEELFTWKESVSKINLPPTSNRSAALETLERDFQTELEKQQLLDLSLSVREELNENLDSLAVSPCMSPVQLASSPTNLKGNKNKFKNKLQNQNLEYGKIQRSLWESNAPLQHKLLSHYLSSCQL